MINTFYEINSKQGMIKNVVFKNLSKNITKKLFHIFILQIDFGRNKEKNSLIQQFFKCLLMLVLSSANIADEQEAMLRSLELPQIGCQLSNLRYVQCQTRVRNRIPNVVWFFLLKITNGQIDEISFYCFCFNLLDHVLFHDPQKQYLPASHLFNNYIKKKS